MSLFKKIFKKKPVIDVQPVGKLLIIDENAELLHEIFGISEERSQELLEICLDVYSKNNLLHECLTTVVDKCNHVNEVVFATMVMQKVIESYALKDRMTEMMNKRF